MNKILLIDYDQSALASLQEILIKEGYRVVTAGDGQAGWDKFKRESPDLVLMEAMLSKVHGFELCQRITSDRTSRTPVFIMTGVYKDRVSRTEALRTYRASEYFEKPLKMAELLASIEAVLGKPETKSAAEPTPAELAQEAGPEPVLAYPRKIDKPKPVEEEFAWSVDLEKLRREIPKTKVREPSRLEPSIEARLDTIANELLRTAGVDPTPRHKAVENNPQERKEHKDNGNGNGNGNIDIDQFLKSALAGIDLNNENVKVPKTAPLPPPPPVKRPRPVPPPVIVKPKPTPRPPPAVAEKPAAERPRPAPVAPPAAAFSRPAPSDTLTPGDPGSDASPFFTPEKKKTEKPRTPVPPPAPKWPKAAGQAAPTKPGTKAREAEVISSSQILSDICKDKPKKALSPLLAVGAGVAVIVVIGFFILRPKWPATPADDGLKSPQTVTQSNVAKKPAKKVPRVEAKPKPAAPKSEVETQTKVDDIGPSSEDAILLPIAPANMPSTIGNPIAPGDGQGQNAVGSRAVQADPPLIKTEGSAPPAKIEENPTQGAADDAGTSANPGTAAAAPANPTVNEGDLVDLASVAEPPRTLKTVDPVYPLSAQRAGVEGSITVNALIDEKGNVIDTSILKGIQDDKGLGKAAEAALKKWKFQPAMKGGVNVKVWKPFVIVFKTANKIG